MRCAIPGTDIAYDPTICYGMSGTDIGYAATRRAGEPAEDWSTEPFFPRCNALTAYASGTENAGRSMFCLYRHSPRQYHQLCGVYTIPGPSIAYGEAPAMSGIAHPVLTQPSTGCWYSVTCCLPMLVVCHVGY
eukprot:1600828-Rhodomonas_salina.2